MEKNEKKTLVNKDVFCYNKTNKYTCINMLIFG